MTFIKNFLKDEDGASAVEYAILVGLVATAVAAGVALFTDDLKTGLENVGGKVSTATN